jgi:hypothetical protein
VCQETCFIESGVCEEESGAVCDDGRTSCVMDCNEVILDGTINATINATEQLLNCTDLCDDDRVDCIGYGLGNCTAAQADCLTFCGNNTSSDSNMSAIVESIMEMELEEATEDGNETITTTPCDMNCNTTFSTCEQLACSTQHGQCLSVCFDNHESGDIGEVEYTECVGLCDNNGCIDIVIDHCIMDQELCLTNCTSIAFNVTGAVCEEQCSTVFDFCCIATEEGCIEDCMEGLSMGNLTEPEKNACVSPGCVTLRNDCTAGTTGDCMLNHTTCVLEC